jgi:VWFA-related protein
VKCASSPRRWLAAVLVGVGATVAAQTPRFATGTDVVVVDVLVQKDGKAVEGLAAPDFELRDSGVPQQVMLAAVSSLPVHLLLVLDTSASVRGAALDHLKAAARAAIGTLRPTDEAALLTFSHAVRLGAAWTADRARLTQAIDAATAEGSTSLADAAFAALALRGKPGVRRLVLFFTDGDDTASWTQPTDVLAVARRSDAVVYGVTLPTAAVTISPGTPLEPLLAAQPSLYRNLLLPMMARDTGGEAIAAASTATLATTFTDIVSRFNHRYVLTYTPAGVTATGWRPLEVSVRGEGMAVTARRGYVR